jgi:hypothetical protein
MPENPNRSALWNALLTVGGIALTAWMGWISLSIIDIQTSTQDRFTNLDGERMRQDITDITTDIDRRLSLSENDTRWVKSIIMSSGVIEKHTFGHVGNVLPPMMMPQPIPQPAPDPEQLEPAPAPPVPDGPEQIRRYDIRGKK